MTDDEIVYEFFYWNPEMPPTLAGLASYQAKTLGFDRDVWRLVSRWSATDPNRFRDVILGYSIQPLANCN